MFFINKIRLLRCAGIHKLRNYDNREEFLKYHQKSTWSEEGEIMLGSLVTVVEFHSKASDIQYLCFCI